MKKVFNIKYQDIISTKNLLKAWEEFSDGKEKRDNILEFKKNLMQNIFNLHNDLTSKNYKHGRYEAFNISDPKPRNIHSASVRDKLLHRAVYRILYSHFDKTFLSESYSCRLGKGTHRALNKFKNFAYKESKNHHKTLWVLKCDIKKFFANINHEILIKILKEYMQNENIIWLLEKIIKSFSTKNKPDIGLPLGNLTSQLFVNIYMNKFDQWIKHRIKVKYYIRYADDFVIFNTEKDVLLELVPKIADFLEEELKLTLHPDKIIVKTLASGVDFLGWIYFPTYRVLRTSTKRRTIKALEESENLNKLNSYYGFLKHGNQFLFRNQIENKIRKIEEKEKLNL